MYYILNVGITQNDIIGGVFNVFIYPETASRISCDYIDDTDLFAVFIAIHALKFTLVVVFLRRLLVKDCNHFSHCFTSPSYQVICYYVLYRLYTIIAL